MFADHVVKSPRGFELIKQVLGLTIRIPVKPAVTRTKHGILIGHEVDTTRAILVNLPNGQTQVITV